MLRTSARLLLVAIAAAIVPPGASALTISYRVDRTLGPSLRGGVITVFGTVTVDDAGPTVSDWDITVTSTALGLAVTLHPGNSVFESSSTTLTATSTQLTVEAGVPAVWGPRLYDPGSSLTHEWLLVTGALDPFTEQATIDFADPDPGSDFAVVPRVNPTIFFVVPEAATLTYLAVALAAFAGVRRASRARRVRAIGDPI
jgi:hypothetical protein